MYSRKVCAVIRELSTNARDSHVAAGTMDKPFKVHLPTFSEQYFSIRDYGIGLSIQVFDTDPIEDGDATPIFEGSYGEVSRFVSEHGDGDNLYVLDEAMSLYTTYFHSNKIHSNDFVGQLGLGSKSPFAYSDSFEVVVWYNGERRQYQCAIGEDGIPEINYIKQMTTLCDEPSGLEVIIPVKVNDISEFQREAKYVYARFEDIKPDVNLEDWKHPVIEYSLRGDDKTWGLRVNSTSMELAASGKQYVIMGNIAYPIDGSSVLGYCDSEKAKYLLRLPLDLKMPIGSCDIAPSREQLGYKKRTCKAIAARLEEIVQEMTAVVSEKLKKAKTLWDARCLAFEYFYDTNSPLKSIREIADVTQLKWGGHNLKHVAYIDVGKLDGVTVHKYSAVEQYRWSTGTTVKCTQSEVARLSPGNGVLFYLDDLPRGSKSRLMQKVREQKIDNAYLVKFDDDNAKKKFLLTLGADDGIMKKASDLPKCNYKRSSGSYNKASGMTFELSGRHSTRRNYEYWSETDVEMDDGGVYVEINRYKPIVDGKEWAPHSFVELFNRLKEVGLSLPSLVAVRPQAAKSFRQHEEWTDFWVWLLPKLKRFMKTELIAQKLADTNEVKNINQRLFTITKGFDTKDCEPGSAFGAFVRHYLAMYNNHRNLKDNWHAWQTIIRDCGLTTDKVAAQYKLQDDEEIVYKTYPLIQDYLNRTYGCSNLSGEVIKHFQQYIKLIDSNEEEDDG
jgi:hypothetical protein